MRNKDKDQMPQLIRGFAKEKYYSLLQAHTEQIAAMQNLFHDSSVDGKEDLVKTLQSYHIDGLPMGAPCRSDLWDVQKKHRMLQSFLHEPSTLLAWNKATMERIEQTEIRSSFLDTHVKLRYDTCQHMNQMLVDLIEVEKANDEKPREIPESDAVGRVKKINLCYKVLANGERTEALLCELSSY